MSRAVSMTQGPLVPILLRVALPITFANLLQSAYQLVNTLFVGRLGAESVAAVAASGPLFEVLISLGSGLSTAGAVLMAQHAGAGAGGHHHRPGLGEQRQLGAGHGAGLLGVARGVGRLAAATLRLGKMHAQAFALQQADAVHAGFGIEEIHHAGAEQIDLSRLLLRIGPRRRQGRRGAGGVGGGVVEKIVHQASLRVGPVIRGPAATGAAAGNRMISAPACR